MWIFCIDICTYVVIELLMFLNKFLQNCLQMFMLQIVLLKKLLSEEKNYSVSIMYVWGGYILTIYVKYCVPYY